VKNYTVPIRFSPKETPEFITIQRLVATLVAEKKEMYKINGNMIVFAEIIV
jgi:hypothetical protein